MKESILTHINNPNQLEKLYRENKATFKAEFNLLYPQLGGNTLAEFWNERLNYENVEIAWGSKNDIAFVVIASLLAGVIAKFPAIFHINPEFFYQRNTGFIVFPFITAYFIRRNKTSVRKSVLAAVVFLITIIFINLFPSDTSSNTLTLSCIYLPLLLWAVLGFVYVGDNLSNYQHRINFLRYNGDLIIMTGLLGIAGIILSGITVGLFSALGYKIKEFYFQYIGIFGAAALPMVATYVTQSNPQLVNKVSPVIAKIFTPLVLVMLIVYLAAILHSGKNPYTDRDFLTVFNVLLIGVLAIILFSVAETSGKNADRTVSFILLALSIVTVIINGIALTAILFRISEWGMTPNRMAVSGGNILVLINLLMVTIKFYKNVTKKADTSAIVNSISFFLPFYIVWSIIVVFIFPLIYSFR